MAQALVDTRKLIWQQRQRSPDTPPLLAVISDCRANVGLRSATTCTDPFEQALRVCESLRQDKVHSIVLDPAPRSNRFGLAQGVADSLGGEYIPLDELRATTVRAAVRRAQLSKTHSIY